MSRLRQVGRLLVPLGIGCTVAFVPRMTGDLDGRGTVGFIKLGFQYLALPGTVVALLVSRNAHDYSFWLVDAVDALFYSSLFYFLLLAWARQRVDKVKVGSE